MPFSVYRDLKRTFTWFTLQHCEQLIQELQYKNLVFQQKLAVAVKVDETKNNTIQQFRDALNSLSSKLEKLNEEKASWDRDVARLKNDHSMAMESASQVSNRKITL